MSAVLPPLKAPGAIDPQARLAMHRKRKTINIVALTLAMTAMVFGLFWLVWILFTTLKLGVTGMSWTLFTESTPDPTSTGGLANAIVGSLMMVTLATLVGTPLGIPLHPTQLYDAGAELIILGVLLATGMIPPSWAIGDGKYALLLGVNFYGLGLCITGFLLPVAWQTLRGKR